MTAQTSSKSSNAPKDARAATRYLNWLKYGSLALILLSLLVLFKQLPTDLLIDRLKGWIESLGWLGPVVFALIYIVAVVIMAPGSLLTLAGGTIFGLALGTVVVVVAANTGAAFAFLIARYLARDAVAKKIEKRPKFKAVDRAISEGGWKVVAMLRLSPAIPFNIQNYMYGLTGVRFWTCVSTSLIAMLPGTFLYVYLGAVAGAALGGARQKTPAEWIALVVGLLATIGVTIYVTRLAKKKLDEQTNIANEGQVDDPSGSEDDDKPVKSSSPWSAIAVALVALALVGLTVTTFVKPNFITGLLGVPPQVTLKEAYESKPDGPSVDHALFDRVLKEHVDDAGWVDYAAIKSDPASLDTYIASLEQAPFDDLGRNEKLALLINAYNAFTLRLIVDHYPVNSILDISADKRWKDVRWRIGKHTWSLNQIEHEQIRPMFLEPRIHFALVCAAVSCPILRNEAYTADRIDEQLADQMRYTHTHPRWYRFISADATEDEAAVHLTSLYKWYASDFKQVADSLLHYVAAYRPNDEIADRLKDGQTLRIKWIEYDWSLNDVSNKP